MTTTGDVDVTLTATNAPLLTAVTSNLMITRATVLNTSATNRGVWISRVSPLGVATLVVQGTGASAFKVAPGQTQTLPLSGFVLSSTESFSGFASAGAVVNVSLSWAVPST
jgi:hypothetical protein